MNEIKAITAEIITHLSQMDIKASPNNLNQSLAIHNCIARINDLCASIAAAAAADVKKVDKK